MVGIPTMHGRNPGLWIRRLSTVQHPGPYSPGSCYTQSSFRLSTVQDLGQRINTLSGNRKRMNKGGPHHQFQGATRACGAAPQAPRMVGNPAPPAGRAAPGRASDRADSALVARLRCIAGDLDRHIIMPRSGPKKYDWRPGPVTAELLRRHLRGEVTLGAELRHRSGMAFAVCWDADNPRLRGVPRRRAPAAGGGARPVLERSPTAGKHHGGGRLWLFFARPIDPGRASAGAHLTAVAHARFGEKRQDSRCRRPLSWP